MNDQASSPSPIMSAEHAAVIGILCERLPLAEVNWALTGSAGHRLQGVDIPVHDIDVQTDLESVNRAAERLAEFVSAWPEDWETERMRSTFGTLRIGGVVVELMGGIRKRAASEQEWGPAVDPADHRRLIRLGDLVIPVLTLEYEARAYAEMGRHERAHLLDRVVNSWGER